MFGAAHLATERASSEPTPLDLNRKSHAAAQEIFSPINGTPPAGGTRTETKKGSLAFRNQSSDREEAPVASEAQKSRYRARPSMSFRRATKQPASVASGSITFRRKPKIVGMGLPDVRSDGISSALREDFFGNTGVRFTAEPRIEPKLQAWSRIATFWQYDPRVFHPRPKLAERYHVIGSKW